MLTDEQKQKLLKDEINGYAKILSDKGVDVNAFDDLVELGLEIRDIVRVLEHYKQLARTSTN